MNKTSIYKSPEGQRAIMTCYDAVLERWPVLFEEINISTRHGDTFVISSGEASAPALILLHGSCSNAVSWIGDISDYSRSFRVYAVDIPGEPGRSSPNRPACASPAYAEWLEDLLDALKVKKASLLGISQGGWTALKFATYKPERVEKIVLLTPGGIVPARMSFILRAVVLSLFGKSGARAINRITFGNQPIHEDAVNFMNTIMTHFKPRIGALPMFTDEELKRLNMPALLIVGARDALFASEKMVERIKKLAPHLTANILPEAGHVLINLTAQTIPFLTGKECAPKEL